MLQFKLADGNKLCIRGEHIESVLETVGAVAGLKKGKIYIMLVGKSGERYVLSLEENFEDVVEAVSKL